MTFQKQNYMKKIVILMAFFAFFLGNTYAQDGLRIGFQASPTLSWLDVIDNNQVNNNGSNLGLKLGLMGEYYFKENYAFFAGIGFAFNQGGKLQFEDEGRHWPDSDLPIISPNDPEFTDVFPMGTTLQYKIQAVEIPFGLKLKTKEFGYLQYYVEIPTFTLGFRSQARGKIEGDNIPDIIENDDYIIKREVNPFTFSWGVGLGAEYNLSSSTAIVAGLSFQRVFTDILKDRQSFDNAKANMNNLTLRIAVMF
jgi:hypothetical protein